MWGIEGKRQGKEGNGRRDEGRKGKETTMKEEVRIKVKLCEV